MDELRNGKSRPFALNGSGGIAHDGFEDMVAPPASGKANGHGAKRLPGTKPPAKITARAQKEPRGSTHGGTIALPHYVFDHAFYVSHHVDIATVMKSTPSFDPLLHFYQFGLREGRQASYAFDLSYVHQRLERITGLSIPAEQVIQRFFFMPDEEKFVPNRWFNPWVFTQLYEKRFPKLKTLGDYGLFLFYLDQVAAETLSPNGFFSEEAYLARHPDIAAQVAAGEVESGFKHFLHHAGGYRGTIPDFQFGTEDAALRGVRERDFLISGAPGIEPVTWWFDESFYLGVYEDIHALRRAGRIKAGLEHFLAIGRAEGRIPHPVLFDALNSATKTASLETIVRGARRDKTDRFRHGIPLETASRIQAHLFNMLSGADGDLLKAQISEIIWSFVKPAEIELEFDPDAYLKANPDLIASVPPGAALEHWRNHGFHEQRLAPGSNMFGRVQLHLEDLARADTSGVNMFGMFSLKNGLGNASRGYRDALLEAGIKVECFDISGVIHEGARLDLFDPGALRHAINLICINPDAMALLLERFGSALFDHRLNVGFWVWELPSVRPEWTSILSCFDLIICPSEFCRDAFQTITDIPASVLPYVVDRELLQENAREGLAESASEINAWASQLRAARKQGRYSLLFIMDASSYTARKGIDKFAEMARCAEARWPGRFLFVLKTHSRDKSTAAIAATLPAGSLVVDCVLSATELAALKASVDLYISPHRSEGFGLNIFESIVLGVPALVSDFSGARELLGADYPLLINGRLSEVGADTGPYRAGAVWFEPEVESALAGIAEFLVEPARMKRKFSGLAKQIGDQLAARTIGARLRALLEEKCGLGIDLRRYLPIVEGRRAQTLSLPRQCLQKISETSVSIALTAPRFAVITPCYNTKPEWLHGLYEDLCAQSETAWEWCLADDGSSDPMTITTLKELRRADARIKLVLRPSSGGISAATNAAVRIATAPWLLMVDHDDRLSPDLLRAYAARTGEKGVDMLYCDEDKILTDGRRSDDYLKPGYSPEHLLSVMYLLHCLCIRKSMFLELGGYRSAFDGAQDHDFALRLASHGGKIEHVPGIFYHWRVTKGSTAERHDAKPAANDAGLRAVREHLTRLQIPGTVECGAFAGSYRVRPKLTDEPVTLVVLTGGQTGRIRDANVCYVEHFIRSIMAHDPGQAFRLLVAVDSGQEDLAARLKRIDKRVKTIIYAKNGPFNFAHKANFAVRHAETRRVVLLNDDMEALDGEWLKAVLEPLELPGVGVVGGKLLHADDTVQHAGVVLGLCGAAGHIFVGRPDEAIGYNGFSHVMRNYAAVTGAFMAFERAIFDRVGGFDESFPLDFNDVDFCLRIGETGLRTVYTPFARLRHFESKSAPRLAVDEFDAARFRRRWGHEIDNDRYFNTHLSRETAQCIAVG